MTTRKVAMICMTVEDAAQLDALRGTIPRSVWLRAVLPYVAATSAADVMTFTRGGPRTVRMSYRAWPADVEWWESFGREEAFGTWLWKMLCVAIRTRGKLP